MIPIYGEADCPQTALAGWEIGILGYGNQGTAHAKNLRDSGYQVWVGASPDRPSAGRAAADGFAVVPPEELLERADLIALLAPDEHQRTIVTEILRDNPNRARRTRAWTLAHGFALLYDPPPFPDDTDVFVVAPAAPGVQLRDRYAAGGGVPALMAVHVDHSGQAEPRARAYAAAIGSARAGVLATTVRDEVEVDLFGEQAVLCGGMNALLGAAFQTLTEAGYAPEMAYVECVQQLRLTAELVERFGIEGMRRRISTTALCGDLSRGPRLIDESVRNELRRVLRDVQDGSFAREWMALQSDEKDSLKSRLEAARDSDLEATGETVRRLFGYET